MTRHAPGEATIRAIAESFAGESLASAERFPTGLAHYVYDVATASGRRFVVRAGVPGARAVFDAARRWSGRLRPLGVPLPELLAAGRHGEFPYLVLERLAGTDLGLVYEDLSREQRRALASEVARVQAIVHALPLGAGFGFVSDERRAAPQRSWAGVIDGSLARSRSWIAEARVVDPAVVDRVSRGAARFARYFEGVPPRAFLDDTTTKNVLVAAGRLSGIVDVDCLCFGDRLFPIALTRTALLSGGRDPDYTDAWLEALAPSDRERAALHLYTALFCANFLGELGRAFNRAAEPVAPGRVEQLCGILDAELARSED